MSSSRGASVRTAQVECTILHRNVLCCLVLHLILCRFNNAIPLPTHTTRSWVYCVSTGVECTVLVEKDGCRLRNRPFHLSGCQKKGHAGRHKMSASYTKRLYWYMCIYGDMTCQKGHGAMTFSGFMNGQSEMLLSACSSVDH